VTRPPDSFIDMLADLAGPLGPLGSFETREAEERRLTAGAPDDVFDGLLAVLRERPALPAGVAWEDVELEVVDLLGHFARRPDLTPRLVELLDIPHARPAAIDALGGTADPRAARALIDLYRRAELSEPEVVGLVAALGTLGGADATQLLERLRDDPSQPGAVRQEVDIALSS
jgi:HEAT repeat protein